MRLQIAQEEHGLFGLLLLLEAVGGGGGRGGGGGGGRLAEQILFEVLEGDGGLESGAVGEVEAAAAVQDEWVGGGGDH